MPTSTKAQLPNRQRPKSVTLVWVTDFILRKMGGWCLGNSRGHQDSPQTVKLRPPSPEPQDRVVTHLALS